MENKMHSYWNDISLCGIGKFADLTTDDSHVTCKRCLKMLDYSLPEIGCEVLKRFTDPEWRMERMINPCREALLVRRNYGKS